MSQQFAVQLFRDALMTAFWLSLPLLVVGFIAGVVTSIVQILFSMQDSAFSTIPRLAAFLVAILIFLPWMLIRLASYTTAILSDFSRYAR
jgi:flagellar biosynthesis protein FliQ